MIMITIMIIITIIITINIIIINVIIIITIITIIIIIIIIIIIVITIIVTMNGALSSFKHLYDIPPQMASKLADVSSKQVNAQIARLEEAKSVALKQKGMYVKVRMHIKIQFHVFPRHTDAVFQLSFMALILSFASKEL